ncbi:MAG: helix-turn-helix transcriptional regulator [Acidobacteria bacterium]|nr:helix-turn-helix transcriptional regulator [Acidobacteriota bacterium]
MGHLLAPYSEKGSPKITPSPKCDLKEIGVERWQYDLWYLIVKSALDGNPDHVNLDLLPGLSKPAVSRYAATSPNLLRWYQDFNDELPYTDQVKPFNFLLSFYASREHSSVRPVASFDRDITRAAKCAFDRETGDPVPKNHLKSYKELLSQYHLHPESKFENGDYLDRGVTCRRHIIADHITYIGKEANRLEDQFYTGISEEAQIVYGMSEEDFNKYVQRVIKKAQKYSQRKLAEASGISLRHLSRLLTSKARITADLLIKINKGIASLNLECEI